MAVSTNAGAKLFLGPVTPLRDINFATETTALADFRALSGFVEVSEVESFGEHGDTAATVTFTSVGDKRVRKLTGSFDAGSMTVNVGRDPLDVGQRGLVQAQKDTFERAFRIEYADAEDEDMTDSVEYFIGRVMSRRTTQGNSDQVVMTAFEIGINSDIIEVVSAPVTP